jgi:hypothetical protein
METTFDYCMRNDILGVGWRTSSDQNTNNWDEYYEEASQEHENLQVCKYIQKWVSPGDLVWTRAPSGEYYLARVSSGWGYWTTEESRIEDIDIANVFRCVIKPVEIDDVPGKIVACFRAPLTIQEIADPKTCEYTRYLWNILVGKQVYDIHKAAYSDIFMMLDDQETEDLVFLYLQSRGWYVIPHSRKRDTMSFEYLCVNPQTGQIAGTQVKTGETPLNIEDYAPFKHKTFVFQPNGYYIGGDHENVEPILKSELLGFLNKSEGWLPKSFRHKMNIVRGN